MSKRIKIIEIEFNINKIGITIALQTNELEKLKGVSFPSIESHIERQKIETSGYVGENVITKYSYKGQIFYNEIEAKNARNADIQSKIDILDGKIGKCNRLKSKLNDTINDCNESISNLEKDKDEVNRKKNELKELRESVSIARKSYNLSKCCIQACYNCSPFGLNIETANAINYIQNEEFSSKSNGLSDVTEKLKKYIEDGKTIKSDAKTLKEKINEKEEILESQKHYFNSLKS